LRLRAQLAEEPREASTRARQATGGSSARFRCLPPGAPAMSRTTSVFRPTAASWPPAGCSACCAGKRRSSSSTSPAPRARASWRAPIRRNRRSPTSSTRSRAAASWW